jgi:hypothetical protein
VTWRARQRRFDNPGKEVVPVDRLVVGAEPIGQTRRVGQQLVKGDGRRVVRQSGHMFTECVLHRQPPVHLQTQDRRGRELLGD